MDMTKFASTDDPGFAAVCGELCRWIKEMDRVEIRHENSSRSDRGGSQDRHGSCGAQCGWNSSSGIPARARERIDHWDNPDGFNVTHSGTTASTMIIERRPPRPATRRDFEVAIICALTLEADATAALFDHYWDDDGPPYDKAPGDPNAYSTGAIGRHNVVLAHIPGMGKANAAAVAVNCRVSFPNVKLALVVGVCGAVPFGPGGEEIVLGDVIVSDGVVQYDFGRRLPSHFVRKDTLLDSLGRPNAEIRSLLAKLKSLRGRKTLHSKMAGYLEALRREPDLAAEYPGITYDRLFEAAYHHVRDKVSCEQLDCDGKLVPRRRLEAAQDNPQPTIHFGLIASGDTVMKSGEERDAIAAVEDVIAFEMEGAGVWDSFPCVVIKGACDYADSHKSKAWQRYAAATAAACMKAFLDQWVPLLPAGA